MFPLLARSLRLDARRRRAHAIRSAAIVIVYLMLVGTHLATFGWGAPGRMFFGLITTLGFGLITFAGAGFFSSPITEEKEAGALGLLVLADIPPAAILVGKSTTRLATALIIFAGLIPFTVLAFALGGLTERQVLAGLIALAAYLVFVANLGLFLSVVSPTTMTASRATVLVLLILLLGGPATDAARKSLTGAGWIAMNGAIDLRLAATARAFEETSIWRRLQIIVEPMFGGSLGGWQVACHLGGGVLLFVLAALLFHRFCGRLPDDGGARRVRTASSRRAPLRRRLTAPRPGNNALLWKDFVLLGGGVRGMVIRAVLVPALAAAVYGVSVLLRWRLVEPFHTYLCTIASLILVCDLLTFAVRIFGSEVRGGTLCTLALLPRSTAWIGWSKAAGCLLSLSPLVAWTSYAIFSSISAAEGTKNDGAYAVLISLACELAVLVHLTVVCSLMVRVGALPLAFTLMALTGAVLTPYAALVAVSLRTISESPMTLAATAIYVTCLLVTVLQLATGALFRRAAAE